MAGCVEHAPQLMGGDAVKVERTRGTPAAREKKNMKN